MYIDTFLHYIYLVMQYSAGWVIIRNKPYKYTYFRFYHMNNTVRFNANKKFGNTFMFNQVNLRFAMNLGIYFVAQPSFRERQYLS